MIRRGEVHGVTGTTARARNGDIELAFERPVRPVVSRSC
jgi:hypothetical protein